MADIYAGLYDWLRLHRGLADLSGRQIAWLWIADSGLCGLSVKLRALVNAEIYRLPLALVSGNLLEASDN